MKKIVSLILLVSALFTLVACGAPAEKEYTLSVAVDYSFSKGKGTDVVGAFIFDAEGKIVAARFDSAEETFALDEAGELVAIDSITTKVEKGDAYTGMPAGSWESQAAAFEAAIIGKTAAEVEAMDAATITGCTMKSTVPMFVNVVKKAAAYDAKVSFKTAEAVTLGLGVNGKLTGTVADGATAAIDYAAVAMVGGKVAACMLESSQNKYTLTVADGAVTASGEYGGTKNEKGDNYMMPAGNWKTQAQAFANSAVGKTAAELETLETVSDALATAGCTMKNTTAGYKTTIIEAVGKAK